MKLRASMIKAYWDISVEPVDNTIPLKDIKVISTYGEDEMWLSHTHYKSKDTRVNQYCQIAFQIIYNEFESKTPYNDIELHLVTEDDDRNDDNKLNYDFGTDLWFQPSFVKRSGQKLKFINEIIGTRVSGSAYVTITDKKSQDIIYKSSKVVFLPPTISIDEYKDMIYDLIYIREKLVRDKKSKVGVGVLEDYPISTMEENIDNLEKLLSVINENPRKSLIRGYKYQKVKDNKKNSYKTLIQKRIKPYKNKHRIISFIETDDIYENKVIKLTLLKLRRKIEYYIEHIERLAKGNLDIEKENINSEKKQFLKFINKEEKQIEADYDNLINEEKDFLKELKKKAVEEEKLNNTYKIRLHLKKEKDNIKIAYKNNKTKFISSFDFMKKEWDLSFKYEIYDEFFDRFVPVDTGMQKHLVNQAIFENKDIKKHLFFIKNLNENNDIIVEGLVEIPSKRVLENDPLRIGYKISNRYKYPYHEIKLKEIFSINGKKISGFIDELKEEEAINLFYGFINSNREVDEVTLPYHSIQKQLGKIQGMELDLLDKKEKLLFLKEEVNNILELKFLKGINIGNITIKPTQIFLKDKFYKQVWQVINNLENKVRFLNVDLEGEIIHLKKSCDIYEIWCYFKMLFLLVNKLNWNIEDESIKEKVHDMFNHNINNLKDGFKIKLSHYTYKGDKVELNFYYNPYVENLHPDYRFEFITPVQKVNVYLDAKYRDYKSQGRDVYINDIEDVAYNKYIKGFKNSEFKAIASFIAHSDKDKEYTNFGGYYDKSKYNFGNESLLVTPNHKYGSFAFTPSKIQNFILWFKMIMEYKLPYYFTCWECGEYKNIKINKRLTKGNHQKYHIYCEKCKSFWVKSHCEENKHKLIKHITSYHYIDLYRNDIWWVKCPECDESNII